MADFHERCQAELQEASPIPFAISHRRRYGSRTEDDGQITGKG